MITHMMPMIGPDWWELDGEDRTRWLAAGPKAFLEHQEARYRAEAAAIRCRGTTSPAARKKARILSLADAIRRSIDTDSYTAPDNKVGERWVFSIYLNPRQR